MKNRLLTLRQSHRYTNIPVSAIRQMIRDREIACVTHPDTKRVYIDVREWDRWIEEHKIRRLGPLCELVPFNENKD